MEFVFVFVLGIFIGSFLNVLADRLPRGESAVKGRSHCEKCKKTLRWHDLIPLLSFIFLKGKCRYCRTRLSGYYPTVELMTGALFMLTAYLVLGNFQFSIFNFQLIVSLIYSLFIVSCLIVIFFADLKYEIIPDKIVLSATTVSVLYLVFYNQNEILFHLFSALGACLFFLALFIGTKGKGMGFGDVKFAFLMGLILGYPSIIIGLYIAFLTGAIVGCIIVLWRRKKIFGTLIPFGPFLVTGTYIALFWGYEIYYYILHLSGSN
jgi:leader peptidase (prepilin peptidase) / N-methyltransferase